MFSEISYVKTYFSASKTCFRTPSVTAALGHVTFSGLPRSRLNPLKTVVPNVKSV